MPRPPVERQAIEFDPCQRKIRQLVATGQESHRAAVFEHETLAFDRRIDIQRHIHRRALADRQLADQQIRRALQQDRHRIPRRHAQCKQVMGQLVGPDVQGLVSERPLAMKHRQRLGTGHDLCLEQLMHGLLMRIRALRGVEPVQQLPALVLRQHRQLADGQGGLLLKRLQQILQHTMHHVADPLRADIRWRQRGQREVLTQVVDAERQQVVGAFLGLEQLDALPGAQGFVCSCGCRGCRTMPVVEQGTEQWRTCGHPAAALHQRQWRLFMGQQAGQTPVGD